MRITDDKKLVRRCVEEFCRKMGYPQGSKISQRDIEHLCSQIEEKTKILISFSTLKRIIEGKFERLPQQSTLDALTRFIDYAGWQDFKAKQNETASGQKYEPQPLDVKPPGRRSFFNVRYLLILACTVLVSAILFKALQKNKTATAVFSVKKILLQGVPNTVVFSYDIDQIAGDSFFIQPSWNPKQRMKIEKNNYTLTDIYYEPGYHTAKLISNNNVIKKVVVNIPTPDWVGYSKVRFTDLYPEYLKKDYLIHDSVLGTTLMGLKASNVDFREDKIYYYAYFPDSILVSSDNFKLSARVRMSKVKNTLCPWIISEVYSENSFFYFTGTLPGCVSQAEARFGEQYIHGKTKDLSALGFDVMQWQEIEIHVVQKRFTISIGGTQVFSQPYTRPGGFIKGMGFGSNGLCEVDYVELQDAHGNIVYKNDFGK